MKDRRRKGEGEEMSERQILEDGNVGKWAYGKEKEDRLIKGVCDPIQE